MIAIPPSIQPLFAAAGWYSGRRVAAPLKVPADHPAAAILTEFGGLNVGRVGTGQECATSDVSFGRELSGHSQVDVWSRLLGSSLIGVAETHHAHGELYVDARGRHFNLSLIHDAFSFEGSSFGDAMERLLLGRRSQPMLRPDQSTVVLYGEEFTADHPGVYRF